MSPRLGTYILLTFILVACSKEHQTIPEELGFSKPVYERAVSHFAGPGGINHAFKVFNIENEISEKIIRSGLEFLNNMDSALDYPDEKSEAARGGGIYGPYWASYTKWKTLPLPKDEEWPRRSYTVVNSDFLSLDEFFGDTKDRKFTVTIDKDHAKMFHKIIHSENGYYSYGGYREINLLIVSPEHQTAYYLFRD